MIRNLYLLSIFHGVELSFYKGDNLTIVRENITHISSNVSQLRIIGVCSWKDSTQI